MLECWPSTVGFFKFMSVLFGLNHLFPAEPVAAAARSRTASSATKWTPSRTTARRASGRGGSRRLAKIAPKRRSRAKRSARAQRRRSAIRGARLVSFRALDSFSRSGGLATCIAGALGVAAAARRGRVALLVDRARPRSAPRAPERSCSRFVVAARPSSPSSKAELKAATDAWMSDARAAEATYGHISAGGTSGSIGLSPSRGTRARRHGRGARRRRRSRGRGRCALSDQQRRGCRD